MLPSPSTIYNPAAIVHHLKPKSFCMKRTTYHLVLLITWLASIHASAQSDITNSGGTVSAQYTDSPANEGIANVIDNQTATKYLTLHNSGWIQFQAAASYVVTRYAITS